MNVKEILIDFCDCNELQYMTDYSGRGMFGKTCFGVVCDNILSTLVQIVDTLRDSEDIKNAYDVLGTPKTDTFGLSYILYFPNIQMN